MGDDAAVEAKDEETTSEKNESSQCCGQVEAKNEIEDAKNEMEGEEKEFGKANIATEEDEDCGRERSDHTESGEKMHEYVSEVDRREDGTSPGPLDAARVGRTHAPFGHRRAPLANLPAPTDEANPRASFARGNWPQCRFCGGAARPAILMFGDMSFVDNEAQEERWGAWNVTTTKLARTRSASHKRLRVVILEVGCGDNVRTVRHLTESTAEDLATGGALVTLVRVNLDLPLPDAPLQGFRFIGVMSGGLKALQRIDSELASLKERNIAPAAAADSAFATLGGACGSVSTEGATGDLWSSAAESGIENDQIVENKLPPCRTAYRVTEPHAEDRGAQWVAAQMLHKEPSFQVVGPSPKRHRCQEVEIMETDEQTAHSVTD